MFNQEDLKTLNVNEIARLAASDEETFEGEFSQAELKSFAWEWEKYGKTFVSAEGLAQLAEAGVTEWVAQTGHELPHNLVRGEMSGSVGRVGPKGQYLPPEEAGEEIARFAQMGAFLKAAAGFPGLRRLIEKTQSAKGINSPSTTLDLWDFVKKFPNPGYANRRLWAVRERAAQIMSGTGLMPSWAAIANALLVTRVTGKAAVIAAAFTLDDARSALSYREARAFLVAYFSATEPCADGVRINPHPCGSQDGIIAHEGVQAYDIGPGWMKIFYLKDQQGNVFIHPKHSWIWMNGDYVKSPEVQDVISYALQAGKLN